MLGTIGRSGMTLATLAALAVGAAGQGAAPGFEEGYAEFRRLMEAGRWDHAYDRIRSLLAEHEGHELAHRNRRDIEDSIKDCAFHKEYREPEPKSLISGKLRSYNARTGKIDVVYSKGEVGDFERQQGDPARRTVSVLYHPAVFAGTYTITVSGDSYPADGVRVFVASTANGHYDVSFGWMSGTHYVPAALRRIEGESDTELDERLQTPLEIGSRFTVSVQVGDAKIVGKANSRPILEARKDRGLFGQMALMDSGWSELRIQGDVQPAWMQGLIDKHRQEQRAAFEKRYVAEQHVPAWLLASARPAAAKAAPTKVYPGEVRDAAVPYLNHAIQLYNDGQYGELVELLGKATDSDAPAPARAYLLAMAEVELGRLDSALEHLEVAADADPDFAGVRSVRARILVAQRSFDDAIAELRDAVSRSPDSGELYRDLALVLLESDRLDEAEELLGQATERATPDGDLQQLESTLRMARRGPAWPTTHKYESKNYTVVSDIDLATCREAAKILEQAYLMYQMDLGWLAAGSDQRRFRVFLFLGQEGYQAYARDILGSAQPHTAGLYSPILKQLLIWNLPDRDDMMRTVRHEGFHQYLDRVMAVPPVWLNEGMAEYYEQAKRDSRGQFTAGQINEEHVRLLQEQSDRIVPLERFLYMSAAEFYGDPGLHYAQAWALIHFFRKTTATRQALLTKVFECLQGRRGSTDELIRGALQGVDHQALDAELLAYVRSL